MLLALLAAGCSTEQPLTLLGRAKGAITGGESHVGHPAVGRLRLGTSGLCTATLIGKRTVLTAAHCTDNPELTFFLDSGEAITAESFSVHPLYNGPGTTNDIAILRLSRQPAAVAPAAIATRPPELGASCRLVGYGATYCEESATGELTCTPDAGVKRTAENQVASIRTAEFEVLGDGNACKGDSGGPVFATVDGHEVQIGVTSRGLMPCGQRVFETRVDAYLDWIAEASGGDYNDGVDRDAPTVTITQPEDGATVARGTLSLSAQADDGDQPQDGLELQLLLDGAPAATAKAAPYRFEVTLAEGPHSLEVVAVDVAGNRGSARVTVTAVTTGGGPAAGAFGAACAGPQECDSGLCAEHPDLGRSYCTERCTIDADGCPASGHCAPTASDTDQVCALDLANAADDPVHGLSSQLLGGCQLAPSGATTPSLPALLLLLVAFGRLTRSRRSGGRPARRGNAGSARRG